MKKYTRIVGAILTVILSVALFISGGTLNVLAADANANTIGKIESGSFYVPASITYMEPETFKLVSNEKLIVTAPDNSKKTFDTAGDHEYPFDQVGVYTFDYYKDNKLIFSKTAYCSLDAEYELRIAYGGAEIPTVFTKGKSFKVSDAELYYKAEDMDDFEPLGATSYELDITTTDRDGNTTKKTDIKKSDSYIANKTYAFASEGNYTIVYTARLNGGAKHFTKTFDVKVQSSDFEDKGNPKLTVVGVPTTASINTKVTLPKATATDDYDTNIKVEVTVKFDGKVVKTATVDKKRGFATGIDANAKDVLFDNVHNMVFYPTEKGRYEIEYKALDDYGNPSGVYPYTIQCEDRSAPTLVEIDEHLIPSKWGKNVLKLNPDWTSSSPANVKKAIAVTPNNNILFPYPTYIDNSATKNAEGKEESGISRVSFKITDTVTGNTVINFYDIYNTSGKEGDKADDVYKYDDKTTSNGYYIQDDATNGLKFEDTGLVFNFANYYEKNKDEILKKNEGFNGLGRYTVQYQARDKEQNITTKTYDITLEEDYEDTMPPEIIVDFDRYVYVNDSIKFYTVPTAYITDALTTRINTEYKISTGTAFAEGATLTVKSGERLRIVELESEKWLANAESVYLDTKATDYTTELKKQAIKITGADKLYFNVTAKDSVGNMREKGYFVKDGKASGEGIVTLVFSENMPAAAAFKIETGAFDYTLKDQTFDEAYGFMNDKPYGKDITVKFGGIKTTLETEKSGEFAGKFNLGSFAIKNVEEKYRNFTGFELKLTDDSNKIIDIESLETFYVKGDLYEGDGLAAGTPTVAEKGMIVVDNIIVGLSKGDYTFTIRAFDINGNSEVFAYALSVTGNTNSSGGGTYPVAADISNVGQVNETQILKNSLSFNIANDFDPARCYMVRKISGAGNFALMGSEFTAFAQGSFTFEEGYYAAPASATDATDHIKNGGQYVRQQDPYFFDANDTSETIFEIQGAFPVYSAKDAFVFLPSVVAHNKYANAIVTVEVKTPSDTRLTTGVKQILSVDDVPDSVAVTPADKQKVVDAYFNGYYFKPTEDGKYKVTYSTSINSSSEKTETYTITVGDNIAPTFSVDPVRSYKLNDKFIFAEMKVPATSDDRSASASDPLEKITFTKRLILPSGEEYTIKDTGKTGSEKTMDSKYEDDKGYALTASGDYKIEYIAEDKVGNKYTIIQEFTIAGTDTNPIVPFRILSTVFIIVGVLLIAGVVLYLMRFQKKKIKA